MVPYNNAAGNSGVVAYAISADSIDVQFVDGTVYTYTNASAGSQSIKQMKELARNGKGLSTFISTTVKDKFESKR